MKDFLIGNQIPPDRKKVRNESESSTASTSGERRRSSLNPLKLLLRRSSEQVPQQSNKSERRHSEKVYAESMEREEKIPARRFSNAPIGAFDRSIFFDQKKVRNESESSTASTSGERRRSSLNPLKLLLRRSSDQVPQQSNESERRNSEEVYPENMEREGNIQKRRYSNIPVASYCRNIYPENDE